jgi:hypothetical protein
VPTDSSYPDKSAAIDQLLDTLASPIRREVIRYFENVSETDVGSTDELVAHITSHIPSMTAETVRIELRHVQLPKLSERAWLDYDSQAGRVQYHGHQTATQLLEEVRGVF